MCLLKLLFITLAFYELIVDLDAIICPKGHRATVRKTSCEICPNGYYQPEETDKNCKPCTKCSAERGSSIKKLCTKETNTECQCHEGFVPLEDDSSTCKCNAGFEKTRGGCFPCGDGHFSTRPDSVCRKWKECKSGVNITGTKTSDVTCNLETGSNTYVNELPTSTRIVSLIRRLTSPPHKDAQTQTMPTTTTTTATTTSNPSTTRAAPAPTPGHKDTYISTGVTLVIVGIIGLLLVLTAMTCKLHITPKPKVPKTDSCRRPVEESGDGSLSPLKPGEH